MNYSKYPSASSDAGVKEFAHMVHDHLNPIITSPTLSATRTYTSPLMGTSARAAKRRVDGETGPVRLEGTDVYNQQLQHHYHNVRQVLEEQQQQPKESKSPTPSQKDIFEQKFRLPSATYDFPSQEHKPAQKIITTITTTTTKSPTIRKQSNTSLNEPPSSPVDRLLEHAAELQKLANPNSPTKNEPFVFERKEQYQVFVDPAHHEIRSAKSAPVTKFGHATDLDHAQAQFDRFADDHQAIQNLTRALQEHNTTTLNEYKRLPSQTNPILINTTTTTTATIPPNIILADPPITEEFTVIDALLQNPLGTNNPKQNTRLQTRFQHILSNLRNSEYVNALKQSTAKVTKKKKSKKSASGTTKTSLVDKQTQITESMIDPTLVSADKSPLLNAKDKENQKNSKTTDVDYQVLDAIIGSPISLRLPDSYLKKYQTNPSLNPSLRGRDRQIPIFPQLDIKTRSTPGYNPVNESALYHADSSASSFPSTNNDLPSLNRSVIRYPLQPQRSIGNQNQQSSAQPVQPRIVYRYLDEHGNILKISSTSPSQLREMPVKESSTISGRQPSVEDERRHVLPEREQHSTWQTESKLPTTITRDDLELRDKRKPQVIEQPRSTSRTIPISIEQKPSTRSPQHPNQENVQLSWLPLSYQLDQPYIRTGGYDSDSSTSEHSTTEPAHNYTPSNKHPRYDHRPLFHNVYQENHSPVRPSYNPSPTRLPFDDRPNSLDYPTKGLPRNYIEVFRDGEIKPSEVYSLPFNDSMSINQHHSRYDQYQQSKTYGSSTLPTSKYANIIPSLADNEPFSPHHLQSSPHRYEQTSFESYLRPSKSFDYRPLRTKLQREYKITPNLLVDEWDHPQVTSPSIDRPKQPSVSSPDDVFLANYRLNKA